MISSLNTWIRIGMKIGLFLGLIGIVGSFINFLVSKIPVVDLGGCMGYWASELGIFYGIRIMLSIVIYGYTFKFGLNFFSKFLE